MPTTVQTQRTLPPVPIPDFTWSPVGAAVTFSFAGNSYPPAGSRFQSFYTPVNQLVTFVASAKVDAGYPIIEYRWDLGDGNIKFGQTIGHTYGVPNPSLTCKLEVKDSLNRSAYVSKVMLLQVMFPTTVQDHARV
jgi:hypothetical protein